MLLMLCCVDVVVELVEPSIWSQRASVYRHCQALPQSRQVFHAAPWGAVPHPKTCCNDNFSEFLYLDIYVMKTSRILGFYELTFIQ